MWLPISYSNACSLLSTRHGDLVTLTFDLLIDTCMCYTTVPPSLKTVYHPFISYGAFCTWALWGMMTFTFDLLTSKWRRELQLLWSTRSTRLNYLRHDCTSGNRHTCTTYMYLFMYYIYVFIYLLTYLRLWRIIQTVAALQNVFTEELISKFR